VETKVYYRRNLPHWHPPGAALFVTWRLYGSLPKHVLLMLEEKKHLKEGRRFVLADQELDKASIGPLWLKEPRIAKSVMESLHRGEEMGHYELHAYVVMANHVHALLTPKVAVADLMRSLKRKTASTANAMLGRAGQRFWQDESFDRWCRDEAEFRRVKQYVEWNPVKAGLVKRPEDWPWSSAFRSAGSQPARG
jgi:REP element-mobilizing transposase RayT